MVDARDGKNFIDVPKVFVDEIRELLSDDEESNELIEGRRWSDVRLAKNLVAVVQDWNMTPPILGDAHLTPIALLNLTGNIAQVRTWMLEAAVGRTLRMDAIRGASNNMPYQAGSMSFDPNQNWASLAQIGEQMWQTWEQRKKTLKIAINLEGGYAVAHSDFLVRTLYDNGGIISVSGSTI